MRARRASLLGAAAVPAAALTYAVVAAVWQAHRCGLRPLERAAWCVVRKIADHLDHTSQPF